MTGKEQTVCRLDRNQFIQLFDSTQQYLLVRFQQIESRWGYSGTSDKIRSAQALNCVIHHYLYFSDSLSTGGSLLLVLDSMAPSTDLQSISHISQHSILICLFQVWCDHPADTHRLWPAPWVKWNFILQVNHLKNGRDLVWMKWMLSVMGRTPPSGRCSRSHLRFSQIPTILLWVSNS